MEEDSDAENLSTHLQKVQWGSQCLYDSDQWMKKHVQKYHRYQQDMEEAEQQQYAPGLGMLAGEFEQQRQAALQKAQSCQQAILAAMRWIAQSIGTIYNDSQGDAPGDVGGG